MKDTFSFFMGADIVKSGSDENDEERRLIRGYASTEHEDRQGESLLQKGLDISDFVNHGYFNYDHDNSIIVGYPYPTCKVDDNGFWVEGELLKGLPHADRMWELAKALQKSKAPRRVGFSIEGKVLERQGNRIVKAKIYNVAVTTNPVNTNATFEAVAKSFMGSSETLDKAMEAGYTVNPLDMTGGEVFREEDLEDSLHNLSYVIGDDGKKKILKQKLSAKKSLTDSEMILYTQIIHGLSYADARDVIAKLK